MRCGVGNISKHYRVGHGSVPCRPLFDLVRMTGREEGRLKKKKAQVLIPGRLGTHALAYTADLIMQLQVPWAFN